MLLPIDHSTDLDPNIGEFPVTGLYMHFQFAKLYLCHHVFLKLEDGPIPMHFVPAANAAYQAATAIFTMILENDVFRSNLVGVPHYFHIMISFAGRFLLEVCMKRKEQLSIQVEEDLRRMGAVLGLFVRMPTMPSHPLTRVTTGLMRQLAACTTSLGVDNVMTGSPFGAVDGPYANLQHPNNGAAGMQEGFSISFDPQIPTMAPDFMAWSDFGNFSFDDLQYDYTI